MAILKWLGGQIDVKVQIAIGLDDSNIALWDTATWGNEVWAADDLEYFDISNRTLSVSIVRGQERWGTRYSTGSARMVFDNTDGLFTPNTGATFSAAPFRPGRLIRVVVVPDPTQPDIVVALFTGRVDSSNDQYGSAGGDIVTVVSALDALNEMAENDPLALETATGVQLSSARVAAALDRADWSGGDARDIQTGVHNVQTSFLAQRTLEECQRAAEAEGGAFFADVNNTLVFKARDWLSTDTRSTVVQGYLGYSTVQEPNVPYAQLEAVDTSWEITRVRNDIKFSRIGGTVQTASDDDSYALYGQRSYNRLDLITNTDADVLFLAERHLAVYKDARVRLDSVTIVANDDPDNLGLNELFYGTQFGDLFAVKVRTLHGWEFVKLVHVTSITHDITADDWRVTFMLDDALVAVEESSS